jgi:hypothetical protein
MSDKEKTKTEGTPEAAPEKVLVKKKVIKKTASTPKASMPRHARVYTFAQWARRRGAKQHHKGGLRAFVSNVDRSRSLEEWDDCFKDY